MKKMLIAICLFIALMPGNGLCAILSFDPGDTMLAPGETTFEVNLWADTEGQAILGWGLDMAFEDNALLALEGAVVGSSWDKVQTPDGDGLGGMAFFGVAGDNVLLATLSFRILDPAFQTTRFWADVTAGDLTEGVMLAGGGFAGITGEPATVAFNHAVPLPGTVLLFGCGLAGFACISRRRTCNII